MKFASIFLLCLPLTVLGGAGAAFLSATPETVIFPMWVAVGSVAELPADGTPHRAEVRVAQKDA